MVSRCVAKNLLTSASMLLSAALLVNTANAEEVTFKFTATVIHVYDDLGISGLEAGDQYEGTYTFEDSTYGQQYGSLGKDYYGALTNMNINFGNILVGLDVSGSVNNIRVYEQVNNYLDLYQVEAPPSAVEFCFAGSGSFFAIDLQAASSDFIKGSSLPTTPPDISMASRRKNIVLQSQVCVEGQEGWVDVAGEITSLELLVDDPTINVGIDIKPGSDPNSINLCSNGAVPVAILGSETFDVFDVDTETLRFSEATVKVVGKKDPHSLCSYEDVNDDWIDDLVCHFVTTDIAAIHGDSTSATVNGELFDGTPIEGSDSVNIVKDTCN